MGKSLLPYEFNILHVVLRRDVIHNAESQSYTLDSEDLLPNQTLSILNQENLEVDPRFHSERPKEVYTPMLKTSNPEQLYS